ncbi:hypothetical protein AX777_21305 [Sphingobium yanoikuyae]|uniref:Uncharacterized protein n=1 Tax=Sphingobium yanoikuyae TaxID=13690 RepID=A0A177JKW3_SPHYA|nr:hypothetical protein [Sphingobium yanoikuyae]OAH41852.1 hypothetical protein AX777_21305 [Sphingobium yanoikuyae]
MTDIIQELQGIGRDGIWKGRQNNSHPIAVRAAAEIERLRALLDRLEAAERVAIASRDYASNYLLDEREDPSLCFDDAQHPKLIALFDALDAPAIREVKP